MKKYKTKLIVIFALVLTQSCADSGVSDNNTSTGLPDTALIDPTPTPESTTDTAALAGTTTSTTKKVLLFNGVGISTSDWQTLQTILKDMGLVTQTANSSQLNAMSLETLKQFSLIVIPGGNGYNISSGLTGSARVRVRQAVRDYGVSYLGFCAGAWVAVGTQANTNYTTSYGFPVIYGQILPAWYPNGNTRALADVVPVKFADGRNRHLVWYGGPSTPEWSGGVVARYSDGKPAISQKYSGKGFVLITGPHPEAPQSWRSDAEAGYDPDGLDYDITKEMILAALNRQPMRSY